MAINDLMTELAKSSSSHYPSSSAASGGGLSDAAVEKKVVATVLKLIQDKNGEVSSLAVKW